MNLGIIPMNKESALELITWQYEGDYALYDVKAEDVEAEIAYFINPANHYFAICEGESMVGHCVFQHEARVAGGDYTLDALDIGAGMRPDWTGQGKGAAIIAMIMAFGAEQYQSKTFRATIAAWNQRAQKATVKNGFHEESRFFAKHSGMEFIIFVKAAL